MNNYVNVNVNNGLAYCGDNDGMKIAGVEIRRDGDKCGRDGVGMGENNARMGQGQGECLSAGWGWR